MFLLKIMRIYDPVYDEPLLSGQPPLSGNLPVPEGGRMEVVVYLWIRYTPTFSLLFSFLLQLITTLFDSK